MKALVWRIIVLAAAPVLLTGCKWETEGDKKVTPSGVRYIDLVEGEGRAAEFGDAVEYAQTSWLADGKQFEKSTREHPNTARLGFRQPYIGLDEGLEGIKKGGKRKLWIPSRLAYGPTGSPPRIPPNADIVVEVEAFRVSSTDEVLAASGEERKFLRDAKARAEAEMAQIHKPPTGKDVPEAERKEVATASGLKYIEMRIGDGRAAAPGNSLFVHYVGRLANGSKFDFNTEGQRPFMFALGTGAVIKGWDEGIVGMKAGGKRKLIVPPELGYGKNGVPPKIPPNAYLYFEVELLQVY